jgi:DNA-binding HxlR family transcriptional regulator
MALGKDCAHLDCPLARALEVVGERWTLLVLRDCMFGVRRFSDLRVRLDVPHAVLTERLTALVDAGLLGRRPYQAGRDEYLPTDRALALWPEIHALAHWEQERPAPGCRRRLFLHADCGTELDRVARCPRCDTLPSPADVITRPGIDLDLRRADPASIALREPHRLLTPVVG